MQMSCDVRGIRWARLCYFRGLLVIQSPKAHFVLRLLLSHGDMRWIVILLTLTIEEVHCQGMLNHAMLVLG